ncbi:Uncharacterised protein [Salmonella enterica]|uniref:Uncharacterized protein n=1 Tax=Salmonella enterica TaxID=28901 RepID=A0A379QF81_SALER|nr:Uncharacterised protein [Salmonella enterica]
MFFDTYITIKIHNSLKQTGKIDFSINFTASISFTFSIVSPVISGSDPCGCMGDTWCFVHVITNPSSNFTTNTITYSSPKSST